MKLLLHACCGPCSLEPVRLLYEEGHELSIAYFNDNIYPKNEFYKREDELLSWAFEHNIPVIRKAYEPHAWEEAVAKFRGNTNEERTELREQRCKACYALRLWQCAKMAQDLGFDGISTTLSVSPYQYSHLIAEELKRAAQAHNISYVWKDFRPYYPRAVQISKDTGMYRQNYCGCHFSLAEAALERKEARLRREQLREEKLQARRRYEEEHADEIAQELEARRQAKEERMRYNTKQARKRELLKAFKEQQKEAHENK